MINTPLPRPLTFVAVLLTSLLITALLSTSEEALIYEKPTVSIIEPVEPVLEEPLQIILKKAPEPVLPIADVMKKIRWCESHNRQFNPDGSVLRGIQNSQDVGTFQINEKYHLADSIRLGFDIYTLEGNMAYADFLYQNQGTTPWNWSRHCWADPNRVWIEEAGELWSK